jgi:copper(I)-binding protein
MRHELIGFAMLTLIGCGETQRETVSDCDGDGVAVSDAWTPPARAGQPVSAAFLTLCNASDADDALVGVSFAGAGAVEIHLSSMEDGVMKMTPIDALSLPAGESVSLAPGGAHIMLIGVNEDINAEDPPSLKLQFENAPSVSISFEVRKKDDDTPGHSGHH